MLELIRFKNAPSFAMNINLSNESFRFRFDYNYRADSWYLSIMNYNSNPIVSGIRLVLNYDILTPFKSRDIPAGALVVLADDLKIKRVSKDTFKNGEASFYFIPNDELEQFAEQGIRF